MRPAAVILAAVLALAALVGCVDTRTPTEQAAQWWPASQQAAARCVIWHESRGIPSVVGSAGELGVMQIHPVHAAEFTRLTGKPFRAVVDSRLAGQYGYHLWVASGRSWRPWSTRHVCGLR